MKIKNRLHQLIAAGALVAASASGSATTINFDGTGAPCCFASSAPLRNLYSGIGVTFNGIGGNGGTILNQSGGFGFNALSGTDFLAFNIGVGSGNKQEIIFDTAVSDVSIWAANRFSGVTSMSAYSINGALLSQTSIANSSQWQVLAITSGTTGISKVVLEGSSGYYAYDDLEFNVSAVPEPETYALMLAGLGLLGVVSRRRKATAGN